MRASLTWNPMFLFLKSNFGSRKETTGKYAGFHAVFCGQSSISLHSSVQNWGVLLWLLYCFTVEVVRAKKCFFFLIPLFFCCFVLFSYKLFLLSISPFNLYSGKVQRLLSCDSRCLHFMQTPKCTPLGELPSWFGHGVRTDGGAEIAKAGHCLLTLSREGQTSPLALDAKLFPGFYTWQKGMKTHRDGTRRNPPH